MKLQTSYEVRPGEIAGQYHSIPNPTVKDLLDMLKHASWIAQRKNPKMELR